MPLTRVASPATGGAPLVPLLRCPTSRRGRRLRRPARTSSVNAGRAVVGASPYNYFTNYDAIICKREKIILFRKTLNSGVAYHKEKNKPTESNLSLISLKAVSPIPLIFLIWLSLKETSRSTVSIPQRNKLLVVFGDKFKASTDK